METKYIPKLDHSRSTHGLRDHPLYGTWFNMKRRCLDSNFTEYHRYGARGITVCERWLGPNGFPNFLADMGEKPEGMTLERIDNDGSYTPENCEWVTPKQQAANRRPRKITPEQRREILERYEAGGVLAKELAVEYGVSTSAITWAVRRERAQR